MCRARARFNRAFTLVELLVVIGIIALLISILLPALQSARRSAETIKCASSLKEIGNAIIMYANDNRGYVIPAKLSGASYNLYGVNYNTTNVVVNGNVTATSGACYWTNFLTKYVARTEQMGNAVANGAQAQQMRSTVLWGCPTFPGYGPLAGQPGVNVTQNGYGPNHLPSFTPTFPALGTRVNVTGNLPYPEPPGLETVLVYSAPGVIMSGNWVKLSQFAQPSERCMMADSQFWLTEADAALPSGVYTGQRTAINDSASLTYSSGTPQGQTLFDFYRHGKYPPVVVPGDNGIYSPNGGKVSYNILYADGHVKTSNDRRDAFMSTRMRFPG